MQKHFLILVLFSLTLNLFARSETPLVKDSALVKVVKIDSSALSLRTFDEKALDVYRQSPDFDYDQTDLSKSRSSWDRFWRWFWHKLNEVFDVEDTTGQTGKGSPALKYLLFVLAVCGLAYLIVRLMGDEIAHIFRKKSAEIEIPYAENLENIHEISFDSEMEKALEKGDYRLSVRVLYLSLLKKLNDAELINWKIEKTNSVYLNELKDERQKEHFSVLTRQFEYVWYGDFTVDKQSFQNIQTLFAEFKSMLR